MGSNVGSKTKVAVDWLASIAMITASGVLVWQGYNLKPRRVVVPPVEVSIPKEPVSIEGVATKGSTKARVAIIEYSDFQCPFCRTFATSTFPELDRLYIEPGNLFFAYRHLPLSIHPFAERAAVTAACASRQGKFWDVASFFFGEVQWSDQTLQRAKAIDHLQLPALDDCIKEPTARQVRADMESAQALRISTTPSFLIGALQADGKVKVTKYFDGNRPLADFRTALDELLK